MKLEFPLALLLLALQILMIRGIFPIRMKRREQKRKTWTQRNCSIHRSDVVRNVLKENFFPIYAKYGVEVPKNCKFNRQKDIFNVVEENKVDEGASWKCELCGKHFYQLYHLYEHSKRKHSDTFLKTSNAVCLADYCDVFRCDLHEKYPYDIPESVPCENKTVEKLRRKCEALVRSCLPNDLFHIIYDKVYTSICSTLTCKKFLHPFQDSVSVFTVVLASITIPILLFCAVQVCIVYCETSDDPSEYDKYRAARIAEHNARNYEFDQRFYAAGQGRFEIRHRFPPRNSKIGRYRKFQQ